MKEKPQTTEDDCLANSPCQHLRKCIENSMENMHIDVRDNLKS